MLSVAMDRRAKIFYRHLLQYGVNVNAIDDQGLAALHRTCLSISRNVSTSTSKEAALAMLVGLPETEANMKG